MSTLKNRKLAAILFADIVGYTALMQKDEISARQNLEKFRNTLNEKIESHHGQIIQYYGDGCLCAFDSAVDGVQCAKEVQLVFQEAPIVPVRIGLHSGDVFFEDDNVFGDSVNIASRIESLGVAGAVLFSKRIKRDIANQTAFKVQSLGKFHFKNVEKTMEVFGLANEGLVIPKRENLKGKLKQKNNPFLYYLVGLVLLLIFSFFAWEFSSKDNPIDNVTTEVASPLSPEDREKKVAVLVFENQTLIKPLDVLGKMFSDWLTRGLIESESANVINATNIQHLILESDLEDGINPKFASKSGVDVMIQGRYYLTEDKLIAIANIIEIQSGQVLKSLQIEKPQNASMELLNELTQKIIGYWAVQNQKRFVAKPPKFEAYQEYLEGMKDYVSFSKDAEIHFKKSFELDTTFYAPLFRLQGSLYRYGKEDEIKEIYDFLEKRQSNFTKWEKLNFKATSAFRKREWLKSAQYNFEMIQMDASDTRSIFNTAYLFNQVNHPKKAIEVLNKFDKRLLDADVEIGWEPAQKAAALNRLEEYNEVDEIASNYTYPKMFIPLAIIHLQTLVKTDSLEKLDRVFKNYLASGVFNPLGLKELPDHLWNNTCSELFIHNKGEYLEKYTLQLKDWLSKHEISSYPHQAPDVFNNRPLRKEESEGYVQFYLQKYQKAITHWEKEKIPSTNWADQIERASRLGVAYAMVNDVESANKQSEYIELIATSHPDLEAHQQYYKARILAHLNQKEEAVSKLNNALKNGFIFFRPMVFDNDPFLKPLLGFAPFQELIKPKG